MSRPLPAGFGSEIYEPGDASTRVRMRDYLLVLRHAVLLGYSRSSVVGG